MNIVAAGRLLLIRLAQAIPLLLGVVVVTFLLMKLAPGDPTLVLVGDFPAPEEYLAQIREEYALDQPIWNQLLIYLSRLIQGDLGYSYYHRADVAEVLLSRVPATLGLNAAAMLLAVVIAVPLGLLAARKPRTGSDNVIQFGGMVGYALPVFWLGQMLILLFAVRLGWLPSGGIGNMRDPAEGFQAFTQFLTYLLLPAVTLAVYQIAIYMRMTRSSMLESLRMDYITAARARGVSEGRILRHHALRNAMLPLVTVIGFNAGYMFSGAVLVETVFSWPGVGNLLYEAITRRDFPIVIAVLLLTAVTIVIVNIITDVVYAWLDPRITLVSTK